MASPAAPHLREVDNVFFEFESDVEPDEKPHGSRCPAFEKDPQRPSPSSDIIDPSPGDRCERSATTRQDKPPLLRGTKRPASGSIDSLPLPPAQRQRPSLNQQSDLHIRPFPYPPAPSTPNSLPPAPPLRRHLLTAQHDAIRRVPFPDSPGTPCRYEPSPPTTARRRGQCPAAHDLKSEIPIFDPDSPCPYGSLPPTPATQASDFSRNGSPYPFTPPPTASSPSPDDDVRLPEDLDRYVITPAPRVANPLLIERGPENSRRTQLAIHTEDIKRRRTAANRESVRRCRQKQKEEKQNMERDTNQLVAQNGGLRQLLGELIGEIGLIDNDIAFERSEDNISKDLLSPEQRQTLDRLLPIDFTSCGLDTELIKNQLKSCSDTTKILKSFEGEN